MKKLFVFALALAMGLATYGQSAPKVALSGYLETYYGFDFNGPADHNRPGFIYSHNRHNEVNLNLGFIKANFDDGVFRANLGVMSGTYANANLSAEPGVLKNILEANAGVKIGKSANIWLDAGVLSSHIGFESAISKDCWALTRNISSENTPYYESGARLSYSSNDGEFAAAVFYLNGWQRITRQDGNSQPAGGLQLTWKPTGKITFNYSNYFGTEGADSVSVRRMYHNFYGIFQLSNQLGLTLGFDYGTQQKARSSDDTNQIISPVAIAQYKVDSRWSVAGRVEYYEDSNGMMISTVTPNGFKTSGYSLNIDYAPVSNAIIRLEGKVYKSKDAIFERSGVGVDDNAALTASIALSF